MTDNQKAKPIMLTYGLQSLGISKKVHTTISKRKSMTWMTMTDNQKAKPIMLTYCLQSLGIRKKVRPPFCSKFNSAGELSVCSTFLIWPFLTYAKNNQPLATLGISKQQESKAIGHFALAVIGCIVFVHCTVYIGVEQLLCP